MSARDREGKLRILKDSTAGAFSVIAVCLLLICENAAMQAWLSSELDDLLLILIPALSRSFAVLLMFSLAPLETSSIMRYFTDGVRSFHRAALAVCTLTLTAACVFLGGLRCLPAPLIAIGVQFILAKHAEKELGGINGDIIGACIVLGEAVQYFTLPILT